MGKKRPKFSDFSVLNMIFPGQLNLLGLWTEQDTLTIDQTMKQLMKTIIYWLMKVWELPPFFSYYSTNWKHHDNNNTQWTSVYSLDHLVLLNGIGEHCYIQCLLKWNQSQRDMFILKENTNKTALAHWLQSVQWPLQSWMRISSKNH